MPSFSIEAPAETIPLTESTLLHTLEATASSDPTQLQSGTKQLEQWERTPGLYKHLQTVFITKSIDASVRTLAVILFKNGIDKYWRKSANNAVSPEDKAVIRSRLISSALEEPDARLALQNALVIAKVVRLEFPTEWPDALPQLQEAIQAAAHIGDSERLHRALTVVLYVVKELSTGRLLRTRQNLQSAAPPLLAALTTVYHLTFDQWHPVSTLAHGPATNSLLAIRILRRLLIAGFEFPHRDDNVVQFWSASRQHFESMVNNVLTNGSTLDPTWKQCAEKHAIQLSKMHLNMAKTHPSSFVLFPDSVGLMLQYWAVVRHFSANRETLYTLGGDQDEGQKMPALEKLSLNGILLTRACVRIVFHPVQTFKYRHAQEKAEKHEAESRMRAMLFTDELVCNLMRLLVSEFFTFTSVDLIEWKLDAEEWETKADSDTEAFEYSIRLSSEKLFLDLIINFKELLLQPLRDVFASVAQTDNRSILIKDSVYAALGLSAAVYHQQIDFDSFLTHTLAAEVQVDQPGCNVLRRRIAVLIGQWTPVKLAQENRPLVYQIYQHLLAPSEHNDLVVRITAGRHFKNVADDWEFDVNKCLPFAENIMTRLIKLIEEVEATETKMMLLNTLGVLVARLENNIAPFSERIIMLLPALWEQAEEENLMKQAILALLARLITALKAESAPFHTTFIPIVERAIAPGSDTQLFLLEDALELWHAIIVQSKPPATPELLDLIQYLQNVYELGSDSLRKALEISASYLLLSPESMLAEQTRRPLFASMANLLDRIKPEASGLVNNYIETAIRSAERLGGEDAVKAITSDLVSSSFLSKQLEGIYSAYKAHCTTGPHAKAPAVDGVVETDYLSVLARIGLGSSTALLQTIQGSAPANSAETNNVEDKMKWLLEEWFSHVENIGDPSRRKLMCLALTKLLETNNAFILCNLQLLMTLWTDVVTELRDVSDVDGSGATDPLADGLVYGNKSNDEGYEPESAEDVRRKELSAADPVHTVRLAEWIRHFLGASIAHAGGEEVFQNQWLVNVDKDVLQSFGALGIM